MLNVDNSEDVLDARDVISRFEELETEKNDLLESLAESKTPDQKTKALEAITEWDEENADEFKSLLSFLNEMKGYGGDEQWRGDWYPVTLVRDSNWEDYAQEYAEEVGGKEMSESSWPFNCIDWEKAARELRMDYTAAEFDGVTYWFRQ